MDTERQVLGERKGTGLRQGRNVVCLVKRKVPLYGKDKMATFERYFIADAECYTEEKMPITAFGTTKRR
ncbi:MAG: fructose-bisphosphatase class III [Christensenellaceae bacterium]